MKCFPLLLCLSLCVSMPVVLSGCQQAKFTLTVTAGNGGTTDPAPGAHEYDKGASVTVQATANGGFTFAHWEGDASGTGNPVTLTMDADKTVAAVFTAQSEGEGETVEGEGETVEGEGEPAEGEVEGEGEPAEGEGEPVEGEVEGEGETQRDVGILIDTYMGAESFATDTNPNPIEGRVMVFDAGTIPAMLHWVVKNGGGETGGDVAVDGAGAWSATLNLAEGDNLLTFTVPDTPAVKTLNLTYTPGYAFGEPLYVTPDVAYVNEDREFTALITLTDPNTNPADVKLLRFDGGTGTELAALTDTGDTAGGDELAGDGIYACKFHLNEAAEGTVQLRVRAGIAGGSGTALSEAADILVARRWTIEGLAPFIELMRGYQHRIHLAATLDEMKEICEEAADGLKDNTLVAGCGLNPDHLGMWVECKNGYRSGLLVEEPGFAEKRAAPKTAGAAEFPLFPMSTPYQQYAGRFTQPGFKDAAPNRPVQSKNVYAVLKGVDEGHALELTLHKIREYGFNTEGMPNISIGTTEFWNLTAYGVIDLNMRAAVYGPDSELALIFGDRLYDSALPGSDINWDVLQMTPQKAVSGPSLADELRNKGVAEVGGQFAVLPSFIRRVMGKFPKSLVLANGSDTAQNSTMAQAFLDRDAGAYLGYTEPVSPRFCREMDNKLLDNLLMTPENTLADAFVPDQTDPWGDPRHPAKYRMFGDRALSLPTGILDGGFENSELTKAWTVSGDVRRYTMFGPEFPYAGTGMACIPNSSSISQTFAYTAASSAVHFWHRKYLVAACVGDGAYANFRFRVEEVANPSLYIEIVKPAMVIIYPPGTQKGRTDLPIIGECTPACSIGASLGDWFDSIIPLQSTFGLGDNRQLRLTISCDPSHDNYCQALFVDKVQLQ